MSIGICTDMPGTRRKWYIIIVMSFISLLLVLVITSCSALNAKLGLKDDNLGEEVIEDVIKAETGLSLDLTPNSPEV